MPLKSTILDGALVLKAPGAVTSTGNGSAIAVDGIASFHYLNKLRPSDGNVTCHIMISAYGGDVAPTSVKFDLEVDTSSAFGSAVVVGTVTVTASGNYLLEISKAMVEKLEAGATHARIKHTITGGTNPSVNYQAFLSKQ